MGSPQDITENKIGTIDSLFSYYPVTVKGKCTSEKVLDVENLPKD